MGKKISDEKTKEVLRIVAMNKYTIREIAELTGISRSCVHRIKQKDNNKGIIMSPLRRKFGADPLPVGMGFKMMNTEWRAAQ